MTLGILGTICRATTDVERTYPEDCLPCLDIGRRIEVQFKDEATWVVVTGTDVDFLFAIAHMLLPRLVV